MAIEEYQRTLTYIHDNFAVVMCNAEKIAIQKHSKVDYKKAELNKILSNHDKGGLTAILTGGRSNNLEIIDFDLKNAKDPEKFMKDYIALVIEHLGNLFMDNMIIQKTPSGGYHWIYRTSHVDGNKKLSKGENGKAIIETRGEGGYFIIAPSKNYTLIQGAMYKVRVISKDEKSELWLCAKMLEEYEEPEIIRKHDIVVHSALSNAPMSGDGQINYWEKFDHECDYLTMLESDGWKIMQAKNTKYLLRRPGKTSKGHSADLDLRHAEVPLLYVWSSSTVLTSEKAYAPSSYLIYYRFAGDAIKAYDWLIDNNHAPPRKEKTHEIREMDQQPVTGQDAVDIFDKYSKYKVDQTTVVIPPVPILVINSVPVLHTGELLTLSGASKAGKSALLSAIVAKVLNPNCKDFGIIESKSSKLPILHFDTEQPIHRHKENQAHAIMRRANLLSYPTQLMSYNLRRLGVEERKLMVSELVESTKIKHGGIFMVILDGLADFIQDVNDTNQSANIVNWSLQMSTAHNCGVIVVVHLNPAGAGGFVKQRGHLGSELQRKTDSMLVVNKEIPDDLNSTLTAHYLRTGSVYDFGRHEIYYDKETGMHQLDTDRITGDPNQQNLSVDHKYTHIIEKVAGLEKVTAIKDLISCGIITSMPVAKKTIEDLLKYKFMVERDGKLLKSGDLSPSKLNIIEVIPEDDVPF